MRKQFNAKLQHIFLLLPLLFACSFVMANAQKAVSKPKIVLPTAKTLKAGKIRFALGKTQKTVDLSSDISGCLTVEDRTDPKAGRWDVTDFQIIDKVAKNNKFYFLLLASAGGNCNVQGHCGATEDYTLIWLKLGKTLKVEDKKAAVVTSCHYASINMQSPNIYNEDGKHLPLKLEKGALTIEIEENADYAEREYKFSRIVYKHAEAEKGFEIISINRERPKTN